MNFDSFWLWNEAASLKSKTCTAGECRWLVSFLSKFDTRLWRIASRISPLPTEKLAGKICWIVHNSASHCPILLKFGTLIDALGPMDPGGCNMVKIHFRWNPRWRTAPKLQIRIFLAFSWACNYSYHCFIIKPSSFFSVGLTDYLFFIPIITTSFIMSSPKKWWNK